jgi:hypothetical protein
MIDVREKHVNAYDSMCVNSESVSNESDGSALHNEKHDGQRS